MPFAGLEQLTRLPWLLAKYAFSTVSVSCWCCRLALIEATPGQCPHAARATLVCDRRLSHPSWAVSPRCPCYPGRVAFDSAPLGTFSYFSTPLRRQAGQFPRLPALALRRSCKQCATHCRRLYGGRHCASRQSPQLPLLTHQARTGCCTALLFATGNTFRALRRRTVPERCCETA